MASDGGLFAFTAPFHGSMGGQPLNKPIVGMAYDYVTGGYYEVASDGGLFAFDSAVQRLDGRPAPQQAGGGDRLRLSRPGVRRPGGRCRPTIWTGPTTAT